MYFSGVFSIFFRVHHSSTRNRDLSTRFFPNSRTRYSRVPNKWGGGGGGGGLINSSNFLSPPVGVLPCFWPMQSPIFNTPPPRLFGTRDYTVPDLPKTRMLSNTNIQIQPLSFCSVVYYNYIILKTDQVRCKLSTMVGLNC